MTSSSNHFFAIIVMWTLAIAAGMPGATAHDGVEPNQPGLQPLAALVHLANTDGEPVCTVTLRLVGAGSEAALPGMVRFLDAKGGVIPVRGLLSRATGIDAGSFGQAAYSFFSAWYVLEGEAVVELPREIITIEAFSGLYTALSVQTEDLREKETTTIEVGLRPLNHPAVASWHAGNAHLHLQNMEEAEALHYASAVARGDGLDVVYFSYLERRDADEHYTSNRFSSDALTAWTDSSKVILGYGEEYRHNFRKSAGYGHVMFLDLRDLILPASLGPDITKAGYDDVPLSPGIEQARALDATVLWCHHTRGYEDIPNWLAGRVDGQLIFDQGSEGNYEEGLYRYLNIGLRAPLATGTDWFLRDMAMTFVRVEEPLTGPRWLEALRAGRSYITNGPVLEFQINGRDIGDSLDLTEPTELHIQGRATGRRDFGSVELVRNGKVIAMVPAAQDGSGYSAAVDCVVPAERAAWFALRLPWYQGSYDGPAGDETHFNEYGKPLFAHTSPIYVDWKGSGVFEPEAAEALLAGLAEAETEIGRRAIFSGENARTAVLAIYRDAAAKLRGRVGSGH